MKLFKYFLLSITLAPVLVLAQEKSDPFLWLEQIDSPKSMKWVKAQDTIAVDALKKFPEFQNIYESNLKIYNSKEKIADPSIVGKYIYNFWKDSINQRGLWRRTSFDDYLNESPKWETVLDIDSLSKADSVSWVYEGADRLYPDFNLCLLSLSRGGSDATVVKEFDLRTKEFVNDGFQLPEAKQSVGWIDRNTVFVGTDFGKGSMTSSGYPRIVKKWTRGTPLTEAKTIFEGKSGDVSVGGYEINTPERSYQFVTRAITFYTYETYTIINGSLVKLDFPEDVQFDGIFKNQILLELKSDWKIGGKIYNRAH